MCDKFQYNGDDIGRNVAAVLCRSVEAVWQCMSQ